MHKFAFSIRTLAAALFAGLMLLAPGISHAQAQQHKVVIQVSDNDPGKWNLALNVAENLREAYGKGNVNVEIVAFGPGLNMLKTDSKVAARLNQAQDHSVTLVACGNTMEKMKLGKGDLQPGSVVAVDGGVVHIFKRQSEGWNAIRP